MKPMLLSDWEESKLRFPCIAEPKIDGVRGLNMTGALTGRSLKPFKNKYVTSQFSLPDLIGADGEFAAQKETHPDLCRITSSALGTIEGQPYVLWWLFDFVTQDMARWPYKTRLAALREVVLPRIQKDAPLVYPHLRLIPYKLVESLSELNELDAMFLEAGYEGTVVCDPEAPHKQGRSTVREGGKLRIKRFVDFEFKADELIEGEENQNEARINELGQTFRSSHKENMVANGMIGAILGTTLSVVKDGNAVLFEKGQRVRVGAGCLTHDQRRHYFKNQDEFKQLIHKAKFFPKGIKDKPRFPTWQAFRDTADMGGEA